MSEFWNELIGKVFGREAEIIFPRFFDSKKNQVTHLSLKIGKLQKDVIAKYFVWGNIDTEWKILNMAHDAGLSVPRPLHRQERVLFIEYVPGSSARLLLERRPDEMEIGDVGRWLGKFHRTFKKPDGTTLLKGDVAFPNFIMADKTSKIYGVDFEESVFGKPVDEAAKMVAWTIVTGTPEIGTGLERSKKLLKAYMGENRLDINFDSFKNRIIEYLKEMVKYMPVLEKKISVIIHKIDGLQFLSLLPR